MGAVDVASVVETYVKAWHEPDVDVRRRLLEESWADDGVYADPNSRIEGRGALVAAIDGWHENRPGARIELRSSIDAFDDWFRFAWAVIDSSGTVLGEGVDFGALEGDGRISLVVGFYGPLT